MKGAGEGWAWFDGVATDGRGGAEPGADRELAIAFARCFRSRDGARVLQHLRALTLGRAVGPGASDATLRYLEGQRALVLYLASMIVRGSTAYAVAESPVAEGPAAEGPAAEGPPPDKA